MLLCDICQIRLDFCTLKTEYSKQPLKDVFGVACLSGGSNRLAALDCCAVRRRPPIRRLP